MKALRVGTPDRIVEPEDVGDDCFKTFWALTAGPFGGRAAAFAVQSSYFGPSEHKVQSALHCNEVKLALVSKSAICSAVRTYFM